jgi:hypothetical protein
MIHYRTTEIALISNSPNILSSERGTDTVPRFFFFSSLISGHDALLVSTPPFPSPLAQVPQGAMLVVCLFQVGFHQRQVLAQYRVIAVPHELP